jgi:hypothetical protein
MAYIKEIKTKAKKLREQGISYNQLQKMLGIPKSTLSAWFSPSLGMPFNRKQLLQHLARIRPLASKAKTKIRLDELEIIKSKAKIEINKYSIKNKTFQKSLMAMLYWAEGSKHSKVSGLIFTNTDPKMVNLFISMLRNCYKIDESKLHIRLHLHYYHKIKVVRDFWSRLLQIPTTQFSPVFIKKRSRNKRFRKNFMGICFLHYSEGKIRKEILEIGYAISDCISLKNNVKIGNAPIV